MTGKTCDWLIAISCVAVIYATLEIARVPLSFLRSHGWLRITLRILFSLSAAAIVAILLRNHPKSIWRYFLLISVGAAYAIFAKSLKTPEEQVHFFEYGLVGIFFLRAVKHHLKNIPAQYMIGFFLAFLAGWIDEILQGFSPTRHYDSHDVILNAVSASLGLCIYFITRPQIHIDK